MQKNTTKKLSRTATATILATSTIAVGLPAGTSGAVLFKDIKKTDYFYEPVLELADKNVVSGYGDGTFRPNRNVTRGEAAKMLALSLNLDVKNAETKMFKDVNSKNTYYKYIAALANKGVISGYSDGTFRPNEIVQRGAMAKMVALGYEFSLASKINHSFKDVPSNNVFNVHIQTLLNLGITEGTSPVTFSPAKPVTRGQLATFISRANKATAGKPKYVVDNVLNNKIYINSVGYTVPASLKYLVSDQNKSALLGAHIEGTFSGTQITALSKLTINATGSANSIYTFDGLNTTFNGTLEVNGSYLQFKNWTLTGPTIVAETPRQSLAGYNQRLSNVQIAGLSIANIIDFTNPTQSNDGILNGGNGNSNNGGLNSGGRPSTTYNEKLSTIFKYVDFTNVSIKNLIVEQTRSFVKAAKKIPTVTMRRDVQEAELQFDMGNLYLEGDASLTLFGTHDIDKVYKNTYYSVYFNTDSHINTMIFDNSYGWVNLGNHVTLDTAILRPGDTPNDVFDDYKNDNDQIGKIIDDNGKEVDRNPIEDGIVPDLTPPILEIGTITPDSNRVSVPYKVNETGILYYVILPENEEELTARQIVNPTKGIYGRVKVESEVDFEDILLVSGLDSEKKYKLYMLYEDDAKNFSGKVVKPFATKDGTPPTIDQLKATALVGGRRIQVNFKPTEIADYYILVREQSNVDTTLTADTVIREAQYTGVLNASQVANGFNQVIKASDGKIDIKPNTQYHVYLVLVDKSGNVNNFLTTNNVPNPKYYKDVTTTSLDIDSPYVTGKKQGDTVQLYPVEEGKVNKFQIYFSEPLDKARAEDVNNYELTGTGIINVPGQSAIKPTKVEYQERSNSAIITIPSLTGFVHGDTLRVTVLEGVQDLAENPFESINNLPPGISSPRNYAEYKHIDVDKPYLNNLKITRNSNNTLAEVSFEATKAGTVYYMILPTGTDLTALGIEPKDFVDEFDSRFATNKFNYNGGKRYLEGRGNLKPGITTELGPQKFDYDLTSLYPDPEVSYDLYLVLKDRSGNLSSPIVNASIIYDKVAPKIRDFAVTPTKLSANSAPNTEALITFNSDEMGTVFYRVVKKYVRDPQNSSSYILNPKLYDNNGNLINLNNRLLVGKNSNVEKQEAFENYFSDAFLKNDVPMRAGLNSIDLKGLNPFEEYVVILGVKDTAQNFTMINSVDAKDLVYEFYSDNEKPKILNNVVFKNLDDTFTITFSEALMRKYKRPFNQLVNGTFEQYSDFSSLSSLSQLAEITSEGSAVNGDFNGQFNSYTYVVGQSIGSTSTLKLTKSGSQEITSTFTVKMKDSIKDQTINPTDNSKFDVNDFGKYVYRQLNLNIETIYKSIPTGGGYKTLDVGFSYTNPSYTFDTNEKINYYYMVVPYDQQYSPERNDSIANGYTIKQVIEEARKTSSNAALESGNDEIVVVGGRTTRTLTHRDKFLDTDYLILVLEDKYGNRVKQVIQVKDRATN